METKYHIAASICGKIFNELKYDIINRNERDIKKLSEQGNKRILEELSIIYKKEKDKNIAYPVSISLNNCIGNYIYDDNIDFNTITDDSVIKIELGVSISGYISILCETFTINKNQKIQDINNFLSNLQKDIIKRVKNKETGDEIRIFIESRCTENNVFPVENCNSYYHENGFLKTNDSKYMILNYKKCYDNDEILINENVNYEFEKDDVYTINLTVVPTDIETCDNIKYKKNDDSHIYYFNELEYSLKLKSSRLFYNDVKLKHKNYGFYINDYNTIGYRIGIRECETHNILEKYPIIYTPKNIPVISKKFTIIVGNEHSKILKY